VYFYFHIASQKPYQYDKATEGDSIKTDSP